MNAEQAHSLFDRLGASLKVAPRQERVVFMKSLRSNKGYEEAISALREEAERRRAQRQEVKQMGFYPTLSHRVVGLLAETGGNPGTLTIVDRTPFDKPVMTFPVGETLHIVYPVRHQELSGDLEMASLATAGILMKSGFARSVNHFPFVFTEKPSVNGETAGTGSRSTI